MLGMLEVEEVVGCFDIAYEQGLCDGNIERVANVRHRVRKFISGERSDIKVSSFDGLAISR